jgi:branched-chain amino acid transport system permease protein
VLVVLFIAVLTGVMDINLFLLQLVTGLALGSVFVLLALGLSLIFGMLTVVNFAHGAYFMALRVIFG